MDKIPEIGHSALETVFSHVIEGNDSSVVGAALFALGILSAFLARGPLQPAILEGPRQPAILEGPRQPVVLKGSAQSDLISGLPNDLTTRCLSFLETADLGKLCLVSKVWKDAIDHSLQGQLLWKQASINEGVPIVEGERKDQNYKDDFRFLRPITISGKTISRYLGEVVGEIPRMSEERFLQLRNSQDPFEPGKLMRHTYIVLVDPSELQITVSPDRPLELDATRTLVEVPIEERTGVVRAKITVPFSLNNLKMLTAYPLARAGTGPIFGRYSQLKGFAPPKQNEVLIMRREVVARNMPFHGAQGQSALVTNLGWGVMTVRQRGFYDAITILETGTCPDSQAPWTYAPSLNSVNYNAVIGGFSSNAGIKLYYDKSSSYLFTGVVPGISAGV